MKLVHCGFFLLCLLACAGASAEQDLKEEALQRVVQAHDPSLFVATGALYLKQEAIRAAGGRALSPELEAEVEQIIDAGVRDPAWFRAVLHDVIAPVLSAEEADEIATHFDTEGGRLQRRTVELAVGEVLETTYTFTNKIDYRLAAFSKRELADLHSAAGSMRGTCNCPTPKEREEMQRASSGAQPEEATDLSKYPDAVKFASSGAGLKYMKTLTIQGIAAMHAHFDSVAKQIRETVASRNVSVPK